MTTKTFVLDGKSSNIETVKSNAIQAINEWIGEAIAKQAVFHVTLKEGGKRSQSALSAYWILIDAVVEWDKGENGYKRDVWDEWFKREAGLIEEIDMMPLWKIKYRDKIKDGWVFLCRSWFYKGDNAWAIVHPKYKYIEQRLYNIDRKYCIFLGSDEDRLIIKTRSISNKGDVTKEEMEGLINCVLKFGAENNIPNCEIKDIDLEKLLKYYDK